MTQDTRHLAFVRALTMALAARGLSRPTDAQISRAYRSGLSAADAAQVLAMMVDRDSLDEIDACVDWLKVTTDDKASA